MGEEAATGIPSRRRQPLVNSDRQQRCVTPAPTIPGHPHLQFRNIGGTYNHAVGRTQLADPSSPPCESLCEAVVAVALRCHSSPHAHRSARSGDRAMSLSAAAIPLLVLQAPYHLLANPLWGIIQLKAVRCLVYM